MRWTTLYAGVLAFLYVALALWVIVLRNKRRQGIGDGGHKDLARAIRVHGNFGEYIPLALILLLGVEASPAPTWLVHACGGSLVAGRLLHAWGLGRTVRTSPGRFVGMTLTLAALMVMGGYGIWAAVTRA